MISSLPPTNRTIRRRMIFVVVVVVMEVFDGKSGGMDVVVVDDDCGEAKHSTYQNRGLVVGGTDGGNNNSNNNNNNNNCCIKPFQTDDYISTGTTSLALGGIGLDSPSLFSCKTTAMLRQSRARFDVTNDVARERNRSEARPYLHTGTTIFYCLL